MATSADSMVDEIECYYTTLCIRTDYSRYRRIVRNCRIRIFPTKLVCDTCIRTTGGIMFHNKNSLFLGKLHVCHAINKAILQTSYDRYSFFIVKKKYFKYKKKPRQCPSVLVVSTPTVPSSGRRYNYINCNTVYNNF
jgi:hypothetical protein